MKPPSIYDYPVWDGGLPVYAVFAGTAAGAQYPIVYIDDVGLHIVAHGAQEVFAYEDGAIVKHPLEGSWISASQSVIDQAGLQMAAGDQKYVPTFDESQIEARLMTANQP